VKEALTDLLAFLKKEQEARAAQTASRVDELLKTAATQIAAAKTPEQAVKVQNQLEEFRDCELNAGDRANRVLSERLNRAINFINNWQQVLASEQAGDFSSALQSLSNLRRNSSSLLDSAALAAKYQTLLEALLSPSGKDPSPISRIIAQTMAKVKSPADAASAAAVMNDICSFTSGSENRLANTLQNSLGELVRLNNDFESGAYARVINSSGGNSYFSPYNAQTERLKESLRIKAVVAANELPELGLPKEGKSRHMPGGSGV
jgi:hypothetical protein